MGNMQFIDNAIKQRLLDLHTAYLGKVLSVKGNTATVQPLGLIKEYGEASKKQAVVSNIPIVTQKVVTKAISYVSGVTVSKNKSDGYLTDVTLNVQKENENVAVLKPIEVGDVVLCVVCDRDTADAKKGKNSLPAIGHHSLSDSFIVGVI